MSPRFVLGQENVPCVAKVVNRSLKADCTDFTGTCTILQKTINGFLCLLIVFLKSKTHQLNLKDVIKLNRNLG